VPTSVAPWPWPWPPWPPQRSSPLLRRAAAPWRRPRQSHFCWEKLGQKPRWSHQKPIKNPSKTNKNPWNQMKSDEIRWNCCGKIPQLFEKGRQKKTKHCRWSSAFLCSICSMSGPPPGSPGPLTRKRGRTPARHQKRHKKRPKTSPKTSKNQWFLAPVFFYILIILAHQLAFGNWEIGWFPGMFPGRHWQPMGRRSKVRPWRGSWESISPSPLASISLNLEQKKSRCVHFFNTWIIIKKNCRNPKEIAISMMSLQTWRYPAGSLVHPKHLQTLCSTAGAAGAAGACAVDGCFDHDVQRKDVTPGGVLPVGDQAGLTQGLPGLVNIQKTMERSTIVNGKIHYFYGFFTIISYVCLPEGTYSNYFKLWFESKRQFKLVWEKKKHMP